MRVLITGAGGTIGRDLAQELDGEPYVARLHDPKYD